MRSTPIAALSLCLLCACPQARLDSGDSVAPLPPYEGPRVVLVLIDGARYTEVLGDPEATWSPRLAALAEQGCAPGPMLNQGWTTTKYGTASIHTGVWNAWVAESNQHDAHYRYPTHWEYLRASYDLPPERVLYVLPGYDIGSVWKPSYEADHGPATWPLILNEGWGDAAVVDSAIAALDEHDPVFTMVYLPDTDGAGHDGVWEDYVATITEADRLVGMLWDALQARPAYADNTVLLVTSDHGRHDDEHGGFANHGCDCDGCREVMFLALGPGVDPACDPVKPWELVDIVPTIGAIQGWEPVMGDGGSMRGLFGD
jgi:hypothetical protein